MPRRPVAPAPDTIEPRGPSEAPRIDCPIEQPDRYAPEHLCPPDPSYTPEQGPQEQPLRDPDA